MGRVSQGQDRVSCPIYAPTVGRLDGSHLTPPSTSNSAANLGHLRADSVTSNGLGSELADFVPLFTLTLALHRSKHLIHDGLGQISTSGDRPTIDADTSTTLEARTRLDET
jgi:hypothetical protein